MIFSLGDNNTSCVALQDQNKVVVTCVTSGNKYNFPINHSWSIKSNHPSSNVDTKKCMKITQY